MNNKFKVWLSVGLAVMLAFTVLGSAAWAQGPQPPLGHPGGARGHGAIAELLGLTPQELAAELQEGKTLLEIAAGRGVEQEALVAAIVTPRIERLDRAVEAGRLTQEQADWLAAKLTEIVEWQLTNNLLGIGLPFGNDVPPRRHPPFPPQRQAGAAIAREVAELLEMTPQELISAVKDGEALLDLAAERGVSAEEIVEVVVAPLIERTQHAVEAEKLTQEQADWLIAEARQHLEWHLENNLFNFRQGVGLPAVPGLREVAELLDVTPREIGEALRESKTIRELAAEQGVSRDELVTAIVTPQLDRLAQVVADGKLTQEQADWLGAEIQQHVEWRVDNNLLGAGARRHARPERPPVPFPGR